MPLQEIVKRINLYVDAEIERRKMLELKNSNPKKYSIKDAIELIESRTEVSNLRLESLLDAIQKLLKDTIREALTVHDKEQTNGHD